MKKLIAVTTAALALLALSCGEEEGPTGPAPYPALDSPDHVLTNVEMSFHRRDDARLKAALDEDAFVFYFDPWDVGEIVGNYYIPVSWTYAEFVQTCANMFAEVADLNLDIGAVGSPVPNAVTYIGSNVSYNFAVILGGQNGLSIDGGRFNFRFEKGAAGKWRLVTWRDFEAWGDEEPVSFGKILATFH